MKNGYDPKLVTAFFKAHGIPAPIFEYKFHDTRKWRMDICWIDHKLALEVQGGIWMNGRHTRGGALLKEWEKLNSAASMGWRFLYCQPSDLMKQPIVDVIRAALSY